jgi:DNA primase
MERRIPEERILEIQQASDIVDIISGYFPLRKAGVNYKGLCPFHDEKTPSFVVSPQKQIYHCFGCHKGGNVFTFLMAFEKVDFIEALKILAERSGIRLNANEYDSNESSTKQRAEFLKANHWAADYYHKILTGSESGKPGRDYLSKRGFKQGIISQFLLGYALPGWDNLIKNARKNNLSDKTLLDLGLTLTRKEGSGSYDRFRNRLIFPIFNPRDRIVGFGGRALDDSEPVYLNSPESPIFSKGKTLYGLNFAKESAIKKGLICIVEGYTDVMMAHQVGFPWVVATLGTALTESHIKLLRRYVSKVVLVYDADTAGEKASSRTLDLFIKEELDLTIAEMPKGLDPFDCIIQKGANVFGKAIDNAKDLFSYRITEVKSKYNLNNLNEKVKAIDEVLETINEIPNVLKRSLLIKRLAEETQTQENFLRLRIKEKEMLKRFPFASNKTIPTQKATSAEILALKNIIEIIIQKNEFIPFVKENLSVEDTTHISYGKIINEIFRIYERYDKVSLESLLAGMAEDVTSVNNIVELVERNTLQDNPDYTKYLKEQLGFLSNKRKEVKDSPLLKQKLKDIHRTGDAQSFADAQNEYLKLRRSLIKTKCSTPKKDEPK